MNDLLAFLLIPALLFILSFVYDQISALLRENREPTKIEESDVQLIRVHHATPELLDLILEGKKFNSLLFNDKGVFLIKKRERHE